jgi:hypothetical protein
MFVFSKADTGNRSSGFREQHTPDVQNKEINRRHRSVLGRGYLWFIYCFYTLVSAIVTAADIIPTSRERHINREP